jgi:hypothetical protein
MEYVSRINLEINGLNIDDFDSVEEKEVDIAKPVNLMNGTGFFDVTERYGATVDYIIPKDAPEFDFRAVKGGTLTIDRQNGTRITFTGVRTTKIGATKYADDNAAKKSIELHATGRIEN